MANESDRGATRAECVERHEYEGFAKRLEEARWAFKRKHGAFPARDWEAAHKRRFARWMAAKYAAEKAGRVLRFSDWLQQDRELDARESVLADDFGPLDYDQVGT